MMVCAQVGFGFRIHLVRSVVYRAANENWGGAFARSWSVGQFGGRGMEDR